MGHSFYQGWQKFAIIGIGCAGIINMIVLGLTELGNIESNFWLTNVFAGAWCGLVALIHVLTLFSIAIVTVITLLTYALLIAFDALFLAQPSTCLLTSSYGYTLSQFTIFNNLNGFKSYTLSQAKYLFRTNQISFGCLGFVLCTIVLVIYIMRRKDTSNQVIPMNSGRYSGTSESSTRDRGSSNAFESKRRLYPQRTSYIPQPPPGEVLWNSRRN